MSHAPRTLLLSVSLIALTLPGVAQDAGKSAVSAHPKARIHPSSVQKGKTAPHKKSHPKHVATARKHAAGEAASLGKSEAGLDSEERDTHDDNRGRVATKGRTLNASSHRSSNHAPNLKTGQLTTTGSAAHLETKETSLHREIHSDRQDNGGKSAAEDPAPDNPQSKTSSPIRLKKHHARMF